MDHADSGAEGADPRAGSEGRLAALSTVFGLFALPLIFVGVASALLGTDPVARLLEVNRPHYHKCTIQTHVEAQRLHVEHRLERVPPTGQVQRVVFTGSSAVVNGIDDQLISEAWRAERLDYEAFNAGMTGIFAYELPLLKSSLLAEHVAKVVYLYNTFSFNRNLHPDAASTRWNTGEFLRIARSQNVRLQDVDRIMGGVLGEHLFLIRYRNLIRNEAGRALRGDLFPIPYRFDAPPGSPVRRYRRPREPVPVRPASDWYRAAYLDSVSEGSTMGYRGFERFLDLARARGVEVIVAPAPEPDFSAYGEWKGGIDETIVDRRVAEICAKRGLAFFPRAEIEWLEAQDEQFRDHVHLYVTGRDQYSKWIAKRLLSRLRP